MRKLKARIHSWSFKKAAVTRMKAAGNISQLAREMKVTRSMLYTWKTAVDAGKAFQPEERRRAEISAELTKLDMGARVTELEKLVGQLTLENRFFSGALQKIAEARRSKSGPGNAASLPRFKQ